jgi:glycosyltransferase involved in cell wall biosynthesis
MRTTCLINSYNYRGYVTDAVASVLNQTVPFDEIIVVDDGSTDGSLEAIWAQFGDEPSLKMISKPNEGQLSCFNVGWEVSTGDLLFFLDADDTYDADYLAETLRVYGANPEVDFVFVHHRKFGPACAERPARDLPDLDHGYSLLPAIFANQWLGAPTSCLSLRRELLAKILPIPYLEDWRTRADDCLILGASLACGNKYFHGKALVNYRVHGSNRYAGARQTARREYRHRLSVNRLVKLMSDRMGYDVERLPNCAHHEFRTMHHSIPWRRLRKYARIVLQARLGFIRKFAIIADMVGHYTASLFRTRRVAPSLPPNPPQESDNQVCEPAHGVPRSTC